MMSDKQINLLFSGLDTLTKAVEALGNEITKMKKDVNRAMRDSGTFVSGYHAHGAELAKHEALLNKIRARCPELRPETDEFESVNAGDDD